MIDWVYSSLLQLNENQLLTFPVQPVPYADQGWDCQQAGDWGSTHASGHSEKNSNYKRLSDKLLGLLSAWEPRTGKVSRHIYCLQYLCSHLDYQSVRYCLLFWLDKQFALAQLVKKYLPA